MMNNNRKDYELFYENFGRSLKFGIYQSFGMNKDKLQDLLMFRSSKEGGWITFKEYAERKHTDQKYIYYATGDSISSIDKLPQAEALFAKGYEILYFMEDVDEFAVKVLGKVEDMEFKSITEEDLGIEDEEIKKKNEEKEKEYEDIFKKMKEILGDKVSDVKPSMTLKNHAVVMSSKGDISIEMEKLMNNMPVDQHITAQKILEINTDHRVFKSLDEAFKNDIEKFEKMVNVLYNQSRLIAGLSIEDPVAFSDDVASLI